MHVNTTLQVIQTPVGPFAAHWSSDGLFAFEFSRTSQAASATILELPAGAQKLQRAVAEYFREGALEWDCQALDWLGVTTFHRRVLEECCRVPAGETITYGELARRVGSPAAARAVGGAMARNRWPLLIPCHRVLGSTGKLTGYSGVGGVETKRRLLELERRSCVPVQS